MEQKSEATGADNSSGTQGNEAFWNGMTALVGVLAGDATFTNAGDGTFVSTDFTITKTEKSSGLLADGGSGAMSLASYVALEGSSIISVTAVVSVAGAAVVIAGTAGVFYGAATVLGMGAGSGLAGYEHSGDAALLKELDAVNHKVALQMSKSKGERNQTRNAAGTDSPYKKLKPDPNKAGNVLEKNSHTGKTTSKPAPPGFWDWWNAKL